MLKLREVIEEIKDSQKIYYIYLLFKPDGSIFYVGKGKKDNKHHYRVSWHEYEAKLDSPPKSNPYLNRLKYNTIRKIWREDGQVFYQIDSWHDIPRSVCDREKELIKSIGRQIVGTGPLTNITEGGEKEQATIPEETRKQISASLKQYYLEHPEALDLMSENGKLQFASEEAREKARQTSIKNKTGDNIIRWLKEKPEEAKKKWANHSEEMKVWHENNREKTKEIAAKRNEKFRTEEHRNHMAEATAKYIRENPEADKARRAKVAQINAKKAELKQQCFAVIQDHLKLDQQISNDQFYRLKTAGKISEGLLKIWDTPGKKIPDWENRLSQLKNYEN